MIASVSGTKSVKQMGQTPSISLRLFGVAVSCWSGGDGRRGAEAKIRVNSYGKKRDWG